MKLRWKYFIVLLVASLVPMVAVTAISQKASRELGESISAQTQQALTETVRREIVSATENYAMITRRSKPSFEFALHALVREAGLILNLPVPDTPMVYPRQKIWRSHLGAAYCGRYHPPANIYRIGALF